MFLGPGAKSKWLRYEYRISGFQVQQVSDSAFVVQSSHRTARPDTELENSMLRGRASICIRAAL